MKRKVIAAGNICLDIIPSFDAHARMAPGEFFRPGGTIETGASRLCAGGCAANTGLAMQLFGLDTAIIGRIGGDVFGKLFLELLEGKGADLSHMSRGSGSTSYTVILSPPGIDRIFLHHAGENDCFYSDDIPDDALSGVSLFHFGYPNHMASMYRDGGSELVRLMRRVRDSGIVTSLDLASVDPASDSGRMDWEKILGAALPYADVFVPSAEELCFMLDRERLYTWQRRASERGKRDVTDVLDMEADIAPLAAVCAELGAKIVFIKCGSRGIFYRTAPAEELKRVCDLLGLDEKEWAGKSGCQPSFHAERIVSATGAGDVSIAAFLASMLRGLPLRESVRMAAYAGMCCLRGYGALDGLADYEEMLGQAALTEEQC